MQQLKLFGRLIWAPHCIFIFIQAIKMWATPGLQCEFKWGDTVPGRLCTAGRLTANLLHDFTNHTVHQINPAALRATKNPRTISNHLVNQENTSRSVAAANCLACRREFFWWMMEPMPAAYGRRQATFLNERSAHCKALCEHSRDQYFAQGYLDGALKVSWPLALLPEARPCFVWTGVWTGNPPASWPTQPVPTNWATTTKFIEFLLIF